MSTFKVRDPVVCADGTSLSVQASEFHYCAPRKSEGPYSNVEVGFVKDKDGVFVKVPKSWREYDSGDGIYGFIPVPLVLEFIMSHGGFADADAHEVKVIGWTKHAKVM